MAARVRGSASSASASSPYTASAKARMVQALSAASRVRRPSSRRASAWMAAYTAPPCASANSRRRVRKNACARSSGVAQVSISAANAATGSAYTAKTSASIRPLRVPKW